MHQTLVHCYQYKGFLYAYLVHVGTPIGQKRHVDTLTKYFIQQIQNAHSSQQLPELSPK
jgi:hypothetical protein